MHFLRARRSAISWSQALIPRAIQRFAVMGVLAAMVGRSPAAHASSPLSPSDHATATGTATTAPTGASGGDELFVSGSSSSDMHHIVGGVFDAGSGPVSLGARYLHGHREASVCHRLGGMVWLDYGAEVRAQLVRAMITQAVARVGMAGDAVPVGLELAAGTGTDFDRTIVTGSVAFLIDFYFGGLGASYVFPIGSSRPSWLGQFEFALRVHVPVATYDVHEKHWTEPEVLPPSQENTRTCVRKLLEGEGVTAPISNPGVTEPVGFVRSYEELDESDKQVLWRKCERPRKSP